jgi:hypothetical protein
VVTSHLGKTIEIVNTDAEGRLPPGRLRSPYARRYSPACVVDIATLDGAITIAPRAHGRGRDGHRRRRVVSALVSAGSAPTSGIWELPLWDGVSASSTNRDIADVKNSGGRAAGSISRRGFLREFAEAFPWAHLDIAATAYTDRTTPPWPRVPPRWASGSSASSCSRGCEALPPRGGPASRRAGLLPSARRSWTPPGPIRWPATPPTTPRCSSRPSRMPSVSSRCSRESGAGESASVPQPGGVQPGFHPVAQRRDRSATCSPRFPASSSCGRLGRAAGASGLSRPREYLGGIRPGRRALPPDRPGQPDGGSDPPSTQLPGADRGRETAGQLRVLLFSTATTGAFPTVASASPAAICRSPAIRVSSTRAARAGSTCRLPSITSRCRRSANVSGDYSNTQGWLRLGYIPRPGSESRSSTS